eukprot:TRINITY_DN790_c4_g1_i1.p1 TRINITY_DN790_c4_g1~~TRINITY_DN790_c4_g1_i1.p1  ORF type:complete len:514 (-),score=144.44 TRINITY_DN790_c4_g1_i1:96-1637(-)
MKPSTIRYCIDRFRNDPPRSKEDRKPFDPDLFWWKPVTREERAKILEERIAKPKQKDVISTTANPKTSNNERMSVKEETLNLPDLSSLSHNIKMQLLPIQNMVKEDEMKAIKSEDEIDKEPENIDKNTSTGDIDENEENKEKENSKEVPEIKEAEAEEVKNDDETKDEIPSINILDLPAVDINKTLNEVLSQITTELNSAITNIGTPVAETSSIPNVTQPIIGVSTTATPLVPEPTVTSTLSTAKQFTIPQQNEISNSIPANQETSATIMTQTPSSALPASLPAFVTDNKLVSHMGKVPSSNSGMFSTVSHSVVSGGRNPLPPQHFGTSNLSTTQLQPQQQQSYMPTMSNMINTNSSNIVRRPTIQQPPIQTAPQTSFIPIFIERPIGSNPSTNHSITSNWSPANDTQADIRKSQQMGISRTFRPQITANSQQQQQQQHGHYQQQQRYQPQHQQYMTQNSINSTMRQSTMRSTGLSNRSGYQMNTMGSDSSVGVTKRMRTKRDIFLEAKQLLQ